MLPLLVQGSWSLCHCDVRWEDICAMGDMWIVARGTRRKYRGKRSLLLWVHHLPKEPYPEGWEG